MMKKRALSSIGIYFFEYSNLDNIFFSPLCYNNNNYSSEKSTANESIINMKRYYISYLSAAIFIVYGLFSSKLIFSALGLVFLLIGLRDSRSK